MKKHKTPKKLKIYERVWKSMRLERVFSAEVVAFYSVTSESYVHRIAKLLEKHGYVKHNVYKNRKQFEVVIDCNTFPNICLYCGRAFDGCVCMTEDEIIHYSEVLGV